MMVLSHYDNGNIKEAGLKVDGLKDGCWHYYFPNG